MVGHLVKLPPSPEQSDQSLLDRASAGDQAAFEVLVHRYQKALYRFVRGHVSHEEAQDVVQLTLLQLYISLPKLHQAPARRSVSLRAWLYRVAWSRCIDALRKNKHASSLPETLDHLTEEESAEFVFAVVDPTPLPQEQVEQAEAQSEMHSAIGALPPTFRRIVWLRYTQELSFKTIGQRLHLPTGTAKTYYYRGCTRLRTTLGHRLA